MRIRLTLTEMDARRRRLALAALGTLMAAVLALAPLGCYEHTRGNPVDKFHYDHTISVRKDFGHVRIQTYLNRTQWVVGLQREDIYDGDEDGALETPGMDRIQITLYGNVEDPPEAAERRQGELRNYNDLFQRILEAARAGQETFEHDGRDYELELYSKNVGLAQSPRLG